MQRVPQWTRFELTFEGPPGLDNPLTGAAFPAIFESPDRTVQTRSAFWDGGRTWRVRFQPHQLGEWSYRIEGGPSGEFLCTSYSGENPLYRHGAIRVASGGAFFQHADGAPFFWHGDTVWNGPLKATLPDWSHFLADRAAKGFNVIQFVPTQWVAAAGNADLRHAYIPGEELRIDPAFFQWLDRRVDLINSFGMVACPAMIWSAPSKPWALQMNPGTSLPEDQIGALAYYLVARYGAHHVAWMLAGDGDYRGELADRWQRIGRRVFEGNSHPVTMHPMGSIWVGDEFLAEPWYHFHGYQSSHWDNDESWRWISHGPPSEKWKTGPHPIVNLEPCYEAHLDMTDRERPNRRAFDALDIRRAAYWSLLASPTAGVTYGAAGVWSWETTAQPPMNHVLTGIAPLWSEAMHLPGSTSMKVLNDIFRSIPWWTLRPAPELILRQPASAKAYIAAAKSETGLSLIYSPQPALIELASNVRAGEWIDPSTGSRQPAQFPFQTPGDGDWVLLLQ